MQLWRLGSHLCSSRHFSTCKNVTPYDTGGNEPKFVDRANEPKFVDRAGVQYRPCDRGNGGKNVQTS